MHGVVWGEVIPDFSGASQTKGKITGQPVVAKFGLTSWGKALDPNNVLPEYPRPQMVSLPNGEATARA